MLYTAEDVEEIKRRAEQLTLLRSDTVSGEQLSLLRQQCERETRANRQRLPALAEYDAFLSGVESMQGSERQQLQQRGATLREQTVQLQKREAALDETLARRTQLDALRAQIAEAKLRREMADKAVLTMQSQITGHEEALSKLNVTDVSELVAQDAKLALQKAELETLEREYLRSEESIFALSRDLRTVGESNAELLRICDQLMKKIEAKK